MRFYQNKDKLDRKIYSYSNEILIELSGRAKKYFKYIFINKSNVKYY